MCILPGGVEGGHALGVIKIREARLLLGTEEKRGSMWKSK